jgi:sugar phosphate isomerase/epimerase
MSVIPFMSRLGITDMIVHAGPVPNNPFERAYSEMVCSVRLVADALKKNGMNFLFETGGESPISLLRLIQDIGLDNVFINLDTGNMIMYGFGNPVDALYTYGKYVRNIHAKDGLYPTNGHDLGQEVKLGTGKANFPEFLRKLHSIGYDGPVTIEREISGEKQLEDILYAKNLIEDVIKTF